MRGHGAEATVEDLGALPPNPQDLSLYSHRSPCYNLPAAEEDRAPVGTAPSASAAPPQPKYPRKSRRFPRILWG